MILDLLLFRGGFYVRRYDSLVIFVMLKVVGGLGLFVDDIIYLEKNLYFVNSFILKVVEMSLFIFKMRVFFI